MVNSWSVSHDNEKQDFRFHYQRTILFLLLHSKALFFWTWTYFLVQLSSVSPKEQGLSISPLTLPFHQPNPVISPSIVTSLIFSTHWPIPFSLYCTLNPFSTQILRTYFTNQFNNHPIYFLTSPNLLN